MEVKKGSGNFGTMAPFYGAFFLVVAGTVGYFAVNKMHNEWNRSAAAAQSTSTTSTTQRQAPEMHPTPNELSREYR